MIIFRYLTKEVYSTLLATTLVLLVIFITNQFIHYLGQAATGGIPARSVMQLMSLQVPLLLGYLLPLGLFLGILLAYGRLYVDNEMTVLAACGVSKGQLLGITMAFSSVIMLVVAILMLWVEPKLAWYRDHIFAEAATASPMEMSFPGRFQTLPGGWVAYVGDVSRDRKHLRDVFVARMPEATDIEKKWTIVSAKGAYQTLDKKTGDEFMVLTDGNRYFGAPGKKDFQIVQYQQYGVRLRPGNIKMENETEFMPTPTLWKTRNTNPQAAAELQWRLTMPVSTLLLALIAVPLSRVRPRKGRFAKLLPAILIYIIYADLIFVGEAAIQKGSLAPFPGLWWLHAAMLLLGLILMGYYVGWKHISRIIYQWQSPKQP